MKTLVSLSKYFIVFLFFINFFIQSLSAEEPVDIWKIENQKNMEEENNKEKKVEQSNENSIYKMQF